MESPPGTGFQRQKGFDVLVVGGGVAGLTAAWAAARQGASVALLERESMFGGLVGTLGCIDDYPSTVDASGADLAASLVEAARRAGAVIAEEEVLAVTPGPRRVSVKTRRWSLKARHVVLATGASLRKLDVPGAVDMEGRGISQCATCDGPLYRNRDVVVVGGGDGALQSALELTGVAREVNVVVRGRLRARQAYIDAAAKRANLRFVWDSVVESVIGEAGVDGVRLRNLKSGEVSDLPCFGVFPFIGAAPNSALAPPAAKRTRTGHLKVDGDYQTSVPGIYAVGAVRAGFGGALVSAAGEAAAVAEVLAERCRK